jgi:hypothetical protein
MGFWDFVKNQNDWRALLAKGAAATPLLGLLASVGPPWPDTKFVAIGTVLGQLLILVLVYVFVGGWGHLRLTQLVLGLVGCTVGMAITYLVLFATFTVPAPDHAHRVVVGYELRPEVKALYRDKALPSDRDLLEQGGRKEDQVWTDSSLTVMRLVILLVWITLYAFVTSVFAVVARLRHSDQTPAGNDNA